SNATFQVVAHGAAPVGYQWFFNGAAMPEATNATLLITHAQLANDGAYSVVVSNSFGSVTSSAATLVLWIAPVITFHPVSQSIAAGGSVTLAASAEGHPWPLTFRWRRNNSAFTNLVVNSTNSFLTLTNLQATASTNQFHFSVSVTNLAGSSS